MHHQPFFFILKNDSLPSTTDISINILISFLSTLAALLLTLWIEKKRLPMLEITVSEEDNVCCVYDYQSLNGKWKFFRVKVTNKKFPSIFSWIPRYTAQDCSAEITFTRADNNDTSFTMKGRWVSSIELAYLSNEQKFIKSLFPDPISILPGDSELLDIFTHSERDTDAYGWNNDSYNNSWRTPQYRLEKGDYIIRVDIKTQNGIKFSKEFKATIGESIEKTILKKS